MKAARSGLQCSVMSDSRCASNWAEYLPNEGGLPT